MFPGKDLLRVAGTPSFLAPEVVWFQDQEKQLSPSPSYDTISPSIVEGSSAGPIIRPPKQRPPVTKAIDIWALGVTFYCLLFGHLPFQIPPSLNDNNYRNEFVLYQQISTQDWPVDDLIAADRLKSDGRHPGSSTSEAACIIRLLDQMLQKEAKHRIPLYTIKVSIALLRLLFRELTGTPQESSWLLQDLKHPKEWLRLTSPPSETAVAVWVKSASKKFLKLIPGARS